MNSFYLLFEKNVSTLIGFSSARVQEVTVYSIIRSINTKKSIDYNLIFGSFTKSKRTC